MFNYESSFAGGTTDVLNDIYDNFAGSAILSLDSLFNEYSIMSNPFGPRDPTNSELTTEQVTDINDNFQNGWTNEYIFIEHPCEISP